MSLPVPNSSLITPGTSAHTNRYSMPSSLHQHHGDDMDAASTLRTDPISIRGMRKLYTGMNLACCTVNPTRISLGIQFYRSEWCPTKSGCEKSVVWSTRGSMLWLPWH
jgi:hypothetical protein